VNETGAARSEPAGPRRGGRPTRREAALLPERHPRRRDRAVLTQASAPPASRRWRRARASPSEPSTTASTQGSAVPGRRAPPDRPLAASGPGGARRSPALEEALLARRPASSRSRSRRGARPPSRHHREAQRFPSWRAPSASRGQGRRRAPRDLLETHVRTGRLRSPTSASRRSSSSTWWLAVPQKRAPPRRDLRPESSRAGAGTRLPSSSTAAG